MYAGRMHAAESHLARRAVDLARSVAPPLDGAEQAVAHFERLLGVELGTDQRRAIQEAARSSVLVITGRTGRRQDHHREGDPHRCSTARRFTGARRRPRAGRPSA